MKRHEVKEFQRAHGCSLLEAHHELKRREVVKTLKECNALLEPMNGDLVWVKVLRMHNRILRHMHQSTKPGYEEGLQKLLEQPSGNKPPLDLDVTNPGEDVTGTAWGGKTDTIMEDGVMRPSSDRFLDTDV